MWFLACGTGCVFFPTCFRFFKFKGIFSNQMAFIMSHMLFIPGMLLTWRNETFVPGLTASIQGLPNSVRMAGSSPQNPEVGFFWIKFRAAFQTEPRFPVKLVKDYSVSASNMSKCHQSERERKGKKRGKCDCFDTSERSFVSLRF